MTIDVMKRKYSFEAVILPFLFCEEHHPVGRVHP